MNEKNKIILIGIISGILLFMITIISYHYENNYLHPYKTIIYTCPNGSQLEFEVHNDNLSNYTLEYGAALCGEVINVEDIGDYNYLNFKINISNT